VDTVITIIIRFLVGGIVVTAFALLGEVIGPKSLAGVFGASPSVAIATLGLTIWAEGRAFAARESRSMVWGPFAFFFCACGCLVLSTCANGVQPKPVSHYSPCGSPVRLVFGWPF
jgi:hypothetical protein